MLPREALLPQAACQGLCLLILPGMRVMVAWFHLCEQGILLGCGW